MLQAKHTDFWKSDSWYIWDTEKNPELWVWWGWVEDIKWFKQNNLEYKKARMWWTPHCYASEAYLKSIWVEIAYH